MKGDIIADFVIQELKRLKHENRMLKGWVKDGKDAPVCCVCGKPIKNISIQRMLRPYTWDSRKCFQYKPKKIVDIERQYGADIITVLKETTRKYGTIKSQCEALGVSVPYLYVIFRKYCGNYHEFVARYSTGLRKTRYVKKTPEIESNELSKKD